MAKKRIRIRLRGAKPQPVVTHPVEADEAERLLREEVLPKIGKDDAIALPGLGVNAKDVVSAEIIDVATPPRGAIGRARP